MANGDPIIGKKLDGGWTITVRLSPSSTGGHFSVGYRAQHNSGTLGFVKLLDLNAAVGQPNFANAVRDMTNAYIFERDLCLECANRKMSRVVHAVQAGEIKVPELGVPDLPYLLFEHADTDIRRMLDVGERFDEATKWRYLHQVATGLSQLHKAQVAHQDVKPSNVLVFKPTGAKIADLGRASVAGSPAAHDACPFPGDLGYAPPEVSYGANHHTDFVVRRISCDVYQLSSLQHYLFQMIALWPAVRAELDAAHQPGAWTGSYADVLPHLQSATAKVVSSYESSVDESIRELVTPCLVHGGEPDPTRRGFPEERAGANLQFTLRRFVSRYNQAASVLEGTISKAMSS